MPVNLPSVIDEALLNADPAPHAGDAQAMMKRAGDDKPLIRRLLTRWKELQDIRRPMEKIWREVKSHLAPDCGRFLGDGKENPGDETYDVDYSEIYDSSPLQALRTAASGLHGGLTGPSTQWFSFFVGEYDQFIEEASSDAKSWVYKAEVGMRDVLSNSNFYSAIQKFYLEELSFLTSCMLILRDPLTRVRFYPLTCGTYWLGQGDDLRINTMYRKIASTAYSIVAKYGRENCPRRILEAVDGDRGWTPFYIIQAIQPWNEFGISGESDHFKYEEFRFVEGSGDDDPILSRGGYRVKPFVATRWGDPGEFIYGRSGPGFSSMPDNRQLQLLTFIANKGMEWMADPAWAVPENLKEEVGNAINPGDIVHVASSDMQRGSPIVPLMPPNAIQLQYVMNRCQDLRQLIQDANYNKQFSMVQDRTRAMTATEVMQLVQEKSDLLGPVVMQNMSEGLTPMLERTFDICSTEEMFPPPPKEIAGKELQPYFTSSLAIAQRQAALSGATTAFAWLAQAAGLSKEVLDVVDFDRWWRSYVESGMVPADVARSDDAVQEIRAGRARQMQQIQQSEAMERMAGVANQLGNTPMDANNALGQIAAPEGMAL